MRTFTLLLACLLTLTAGAANAATVPMIVVWEKATANTDGSPLPEAQVARYTVEYSTCTTTTSTTIVTPVQGQASSANGSASSLTIPGLTAGRKCVRAVTVRTDGAVSAYSNTAAGTVIDQPTFPNPPGNVQVQVSVATTAYVLKRYWFRSKVVVLANASEIPLGTRCGNRVKGHKGFFYLPGAVNMLNDKPIIVQCAPGTPNDA